METRAPRPGETASLPLEELKVGDRRLIINQHERLSSGSTPNDVWRVYDPEGKSYVVRTRAGWTYSSPYADFFEKDWEADFLFYASHDSSITTPLAYPELVRGPDGRDYMILVDGGPSLHSIIAERGALDINTAYQVFMGVAEIMDTLHNDGEVHRDLKIENILLSPTGPLVIDPTIVSLPQTDFIGSKGHFSLPYCRALLSAVDNKGFYNESQEISKINDQHALVLSLIDSLGGSNRRDVELLPYLINHKNLLPEIQTRLGPNFGDNLAKGITSALIYINGGNLFSSNQALIEGIFNYIAG